MKFLFAVFLCAAPIIADGQIFFRGSAGGSYTALRNKSDRDGVNGIENRLTIRPTAGLDVGYRLREGSDMHSVALGMQYINVAQNYNVPDQLSIPGRQREIQGSRSVQYLRIPFSVSFAFSHRGRLKPLFTIGGYYARLIRHRDAYTQTYNGEQEVEYEVKNGNFFAAYRNGNATGVYDGSYYKRFDAGPLAALSAEYDLGGGLFLDAGIRASYGLTRIENHTYLNHTLTVDNFTTSLAVNPYRQDFFLPRMLGIPVSPPHGINYNQSERPQTYTLAAGIEIGLKYVLPDKDQQSGVE